MWLILKSEAVQDGSIITIIRIIYCNIVANCDRHDDDHHIAKLLFIVSTITTMATAIITTIVKLSAFHFEKNVNIVN